MPLIFPKHTENGLVDHTLPETQCILGVSRYNHGYFMSIPIKLRRLFAQLTADGAEVLHVRIDDVSNQMREKPMQRIDSTDYTLLVPLSQEDRLRGHVFSPRTPVAAAASANRLTA